MDSRLCALNLPNTTYLLCITSQRRCLCCVVRDKRMPSHHKVSLLQGSHRRQIKDEIRLVHTHLCPWFVQIQPYRDIFKCASTGRSFHVKAGCTYIHDIWDGNACSCGVRRFFCENRHYLCSQKPLSRKRSSTHLMDHTSDIVPLDEDTRTRVFVI
jgi:hypothetical protein